MGAMVRNRALWAKFGKKIRDIFLRLENRHAAKKVTVSLINGDNQTATHQKEILKKICDFYINLYMQPSRTFDKFRMDKLK